MTQAEPNTAARKPRRMARPPEAPSPSVVSAADVEGSSTGLVRPDPMLRTTKQSIVLELLRRKDGALLADIVAATGWQPHTARAVLTGLKQKGHTIVSTKVDKLTRYTLA